MRYIEGVPPTEEEAEQFTDVCRTNMISSLQVILDNMLLLGIPLADPTLKSSANFIVSLENKDGSVGIDSSTGELLPGVSEAIISIWSDKNVQETILKRSNEFQSNDSAEYFLNNSKKISEKIWKPNYMDILKSRVKTTGVQVTSFIKNGRKFDVVDVGGQRSERRKWLHCFDNVTCLLYVVALNEYNMVLREDESINRMTEALVLYHSIVTSPFFKSIPVILFLNKADLLRKKCRSGLKVNMINEYYPEYNGDPTDWKSVFKFIEGLFLNVIKSPDVKDATIRNKQIYPHMCTAIDQENMRVVFTSVNDIILRGNISAAGLI